MAEFKNTEAYIKRYGDSVEQEMETRLHNLGKVASGELIDSIGYSFKKEKGRFSLKFYMAYHGQFVDKGSKPSKYADKEGKGTGKSEFIKSLMKWCEIKGLPKRLAFPIRKKIWKFGQRPTNFFTISTTRRQKQFEQGIKKSMVIDVEQTIKKEFGT